VTSPEETHSRLGLAPPEGGLSSEAESALLWELSDNAPPDEVSVALRVVAGRGRADAHLVARADEGKFDVIIVGQRGHSLVEQIWRGSIARGVLQSSPVTVATVPIPIGQVDTSFRPPWVVVVSIGFTETDHRALAHAIGYAAEGATVHIAHVLGPYDLPSELRRAREDAWHRLSKLARGVAVERSISIEKHVLAGLPPEQLLALSERVGADLLVLGSRRRTAVGRVLRGSLVQAIIEESRFPVLVVPARSV
ncbi:MAG TPA: universal stress protein, partial [Polyangiaceae bacterium]|nr:universal stress protein [Polyangiaceae bacterium]